MKKVISIFLTVAMVVSLLFVYPVFAAKTAVIGLTGSAENITAGAEFTVTVSLSDCGKCKSVALVFDYDTDDTFELVSGEWLLTGTALANFDKTTTATGTAAAAFSAETDPNGDIFILKLKVKDNAEGGNFDIKVTPTIKNGTNVIECTQGVLIVSVSTECTHTNKTYHEAKESTCKVQGNDPYYVCEDCGKTFADDGTTEVAASSYFRPLAGHTGGTATCKDLAVCSVCGNTYGDYAQHNYIEKKENKFIKGYNASTGKTVYYKSCSVCSAVSTETFESEDTSFKLMTESKKVVAGNEFTVTVSILNNPGFGYLEVTPKYDGLTLVSVTNGELINDFTKGKQYLWVSDEDVSEDGELFTMTFTTNDDITLGTYKVDFILRSCVNDNEQMVDLLVIPGNIEVIDFVYGDCNGDEVVNGQDVMRLKKYLANYDYDNETCDIEIGFGADCNGDGIINGQDVMRLKKYLANYDYDTGTCDIVLGPQ